MSKLLINEPPLQVLPTLAMYVGLNEAIFLQQLHYWLDDRKRKVGKIADGKKWVRNTNKGWQQDNFPFWSEQTIRRTIQNLADDNLILTRDDLNKFDYDKTKWFTINDPELENLDAPVPRVASKRGGIKLIGGGIKLIGGGYQVGQHDTRDYTEIKEEEEEADPTFQNLCELYENEIGGISAITADYLKDACATYPAAWFGEAFKRAAKANARNWRYIEAILKRWQTNGGPQNDKPRGKRKQQNGKNNDQPTPTTEYFDPTTGETVRVP